jgi:hypothetical protein
MGLSNESQPNTAVIDAYRASIDERHAKNLSNRLIKFEHNPDPREAPNPNTGIRIRRPRLVPAPGRIEVSAEVSDHNSRVSGIGDPERFKHLWGEG